MLALETKKKKFNVIPDDMPPYLAPTKDAVLFYQTKIQPLIVQTGTQRLQGMHGLNTHTIAVVFRGIDYALHMGTDPVPVVFACAFHDMARTHDAFDTEHGKNAVPMAMKIMKQFPDLLDQNARHSILSAVLNHTTGQVAPDYISACLWDADRTRLAWQYGFNEKFFNTNRGKYVAQHRIQYLEFLRSHFPTIKWSEQY